MTKHQMAEPLLQQLKGNLEKDANLREELENKIKGVVVFVVDGETWILDLRKGKGVLYKKKDGEDVEDVDITLTMNGKTFASLVSGKLGSQQAFLMRKLKIKGSMALAMKLQPILDAAKPASKL